MADKHYPTTDFDFIDKCIMDSDKITDKTNIGDTVIYVCKGKSAIGKRLITIRPSKQNQVKFMQATALAARFGFMTALLKWYEENKDWKDGAYVAQKSNPDEKGSK